MNKKTILALAAFVAAGSALATVTSENTLCRIALTVTTEQVMIGLPLVDVGGTGDTIKPTDFVLTQGLEDNTLIEYQDTDGNWKGWKISGGNWVAAETSAGTPTESLARGGALILTRPSGWSGTLTVYLYGQVSTGSLSKTLNPGAYYLLGNPGTEAITSVESLGVTPTKGDLVILPTTVTIDNQTYQAFKYHSYDGQTWIPALSIEAGQGFWFKKTKTN